MSTVYKIVAPTARIPDVLAIPLQDGSEQLSGEDEWGDGSPVWDSTVNPPVQIPGFVLWGIWDFQCTPTTLSALAALAPDVVVTAEPR